ncbi:MAG: efflux RND transporter periplasmic adaptor subunit [Lachnospiraceae bacterium]|nr:efflux RND transporter periplasmic adaptor subunit [Lachnospiraceae bacterium]
MENENKTMDQVQSVSGSAAAKPEAAGTSQTSGGSQNSGTSQASGTAQNPGTSQTAGGAAGTNPQQNTPANAAQQTPVKEQTSAGVQQADAKAQASAGVQQAQQDEEIRLPRRSALVVDDSDEDLIAVDLHENEHKNNHDHEHKKQDESSSRPVRRREKKPSDPYRGKRIRRTIIWIVVILLLLGIGLFVYFKIVKPAKAAAEAIMNQSKETTDTIESRDIVHAISTTGTFEAGEVRTITSTAKDPVIDAVMADVGDHVNKGDTLVLFSTENINRTIEQLKEDLSESKRLQAVESRASDRNYLYTYTDQANQLLNQSEKVESALKALYEACDGYGDAKRALQDARDSGKDAATIANLESQATLAYQEEQRAQEAYNTAVTLQGQMVGSTGNTLTQADENHEIAAIKAGDQARNYSRQIEDYQDKLEDFVITAPISGIVTKVDVEEGNGFAGGRVMVIQNTDTMKIIARIDEYDIPDIKLGQKVVIRTDATRDDELEGYISFIEPASTTTKAGVYTSDPFSTKATDVTYEATVTVRTQDPRIKIGMSAKLNIIIDKVSNVLTVPYDAISTNAQGQTYITVIDEDGAGGAGHGNADASGPVLQVNGQNMEQASDEKTATDMKFGGKADAAASDNRRDILVDVGMEGDYYTEVISDELRPGMTVVIPDSGKFELSDMEMMFGF